MVDISRRSFLRGALTVAAVAVAAPAVAHFEPATPILYGDGIHDDAPALNALFAGEPFICEGDLIAVNTNGYVHLSHGDFAIGATIELAGVSANITGCTFEALPSFKGDAMMKVSQSKGSYIANCTFNSRESLRVKDDRFSAERWKSNRELACFTPTT